MGGGVEREGGSSRLGTGEQVSKELGVRGLASGWRPAASASAWAGVEGESQAGHRAGEDSPCGRLFYEYFSYIYIYILYKR